MFEHSNAFHRAKSFNDDIKLFVTSGFDATQFVEHIARNKIIFFIGAEEKYKTKFSAAFIKMK